MGKLVHWTAAVAVSLGGLAWVSSLRAAEDIKDATKNAVDKTKEKAHDAKANWENGRIYTMLGQVTNRTLTKGGFNDVAERFNDADRKRIDAWIKDKNNKEKLDVLDGRIAQFQKDWKAKYNENFKIYKDDVVFGNAMFTVTQGEIGKDAQLAGERIPAAETNKIGGGDRNLNRALHTVAITRMRCHRETRDYEAKRTAQGKTHRDVRRSVKRALARRLYRRIQAATRPTEAPAAA